MNDKHVYGIREYRYGNVVTIWVGDEYNHPHWTRHVWLKWNIFSSASARVITKRLKAQAKADKLNNREMYYGHDYEVTKR